MNPEIVVVGSLNMDLVVEVNQKPEWGQTVLGNNFFMGCGGKGGNQAFAAGKLGAKVAIIGRVGDDVFADYIIQNLQNVGVETAYIERTKGLSTGVASINISSEGDNSIIVAPGANYQVTPAYVQKYKDIITNAKIVLVQLEIPLETVIEVAKLCNEYHVPIMLDPAPAMEIPDNLFKMIDYLVPNETEIRELTDIEVSDALSAKIASVRLLNKGVRHVFAKLGGKGVVVTNTNRTFQLEGYEVPVVDTTAAGDAFAGALAAALVSGEDLWSATQYANAVGALTVTKSGAQESMPSKIATEDFIRMHAIQ
ncbi:ribokinase [Bacillus sp. JJ1566]|uniref:ribokinase n=1 Tax=Bacillus sp. JJ1566 TaxID=3122961 RepID=UPI002FFEBF81